MAHVCTTLLVLSLLNCCSGEISNNPESWYSANVINDPKPEAATADDTTFSPKPLSEIFSTPATFSTEKPIVVLPTSTPLPSLGLSTFSPVPQQGSTLPTQGLSSSFPPFLQDLQQAGFPGNVPQTNPNYFVIYQNAPQSIQTTLSPGLSSTTGIPSTTGFSTTGPTTTVEAVTPQAPVFSSSPTPQPTPNAPFNSPPPAVITQTPNNSSRPLPFIKIRMLSPAGSITNIHVNPPSSTKAPTTTRRNRRRDRNNYDGCVNACSGRRTPICAAPLGNTPINPDNLKGFPSVCHMACHNSFRKNSFEKIVDGRCGRLRTRIRTVDSDKLKRDELNKLQYTVDQDPTVIEFYPRQK